LQTTDILAPPLQDVIELRHRKWEERNATDGVQTLAEIREKAAKDEQRRAQETMARSQSHGMGGSSRGGSRRGQARTDFNQGPQEPGGWQNAPVRNPGKAGDLANFGKIERRTPSGGPGSFGPSTVFGKRAAAKTGETPPLSRTGSTNNMFSMLSQDGSTEPSTSSPMARGPSADAAGGEEPTRKRLVLAKRSVPVPQEGEAGDDEEKEGEDDDEDEAEEEKPEMDDKAAATKIDNNIAEFLNIRDTSEVVLQFKELPAKHASTFVDKLVSKAVDASKAELELICKLFAKIAEEKVVSHEDLMAGCVSPSCLSSVRRLGSLTDLSFRCLAQLHAPGRVA
jgi:translation initiation factor 4G